MPVCLRCLCARVRGVCVCLLPTCLWVSISFHCTVHNDAIFSSSMYSVYAQQYTILIENACCACTSIACYTTRCTSGKPWAHTDASSRDLCAQSAASDGGFAHDAQGWPHQIVSILVAIMYNLASIRGFRGFIVCPGVAFALPKKHHGAAQRIRRRIPLPLERRLPFAACSHHSVLVC